MRSFFLQVVRANWRFLICDFLKKFHSIGIVFPKLCH